MSGAERQQFPRPDAVKLIVFGHLKKIRAAAIAKNEASGFDEDYLDSVAERYVYFIQPEKDLPPKAEIDENLRDIQKHAEALLLAMRRCRSSEFVTAFHAAPLAALELDRHRLSFAAMERWLDIITHTAAQVGSESGKAGPRPSDKSLKVAVATATDFCSIMRTSPTYSKPYRNFCAVVFDALGLSGNPDYFARKAVAALKISMS